MRLRPNGGYLLWDSDNDGSQEMPSVLAANSPETDGITHINVYSKGQTDLGRFLSNWADTPFVCSDGRFRSVEGYWYWLGNIHSNRDDLRGMHGWEAKSYGRFLQAYPDCKIRDQRFEEKIKWAIQEKLWAYPQFLRALQECRLPLDHYYVMVGQIKRADQHRWVIDYLEIFKENK